MSTQSLHQPAKEAKNAAAMAQDAEIVSSGANTSTSRPATPSTLDRLKGRFKRSFRSSTPKSTKEQVLPSPPNANQQSIESVVPNASLIVPVMDTPFKGTPDDRAREIEIYDRGIKVVAFLQELAGLTGPGLPNPVPSILKALTGVLTQLQQMVKNEGEWKELFLLISKHLETFNRKLQLLELGAVTPDSTSALHQPIVQYSTTLREMTAKILDDAGFDPTGSKEKSDWNQLTEFLGQYWQAGEVPGKIGDYRKQLLEAMDLLLRDQVLFTAVKMEETNAVVKETNTGVNRLLQIMDDKSVSLGGTGSRVIAKSLPVISPYFVVRQREMDHMTECIIDSKPAGQRVFAVIGMGGAGKTQLVSHFVQEMKINKTLFTHVVFVDASSELNVEADLQSWARSLGVGHETDDWNNCLQYLTSGPHEGRWVLIFDNADDPNLKLKRFFPRCKDGTILITSRNPGVEHLATVGHLELEKMATDDALATLESAAGRQIPKNSKEFESAQILMQELGYLPLALVHAGTYCRSQSSGGDGKSRTFTFSQYHSLFLKKRAALMKKANSFTQDDYEHGVYTTLDISYQAVNPPSKQFLHIIANYHHSEIPVAMFLAAAGESFEDPESAFPRPDEHANVVAKLNMLLCPDGEPDEFQLRELTGNLRSFSLISPSEDTLFFRMHPLVQAWVRDMPSKDGYDYRAMATQIVTSCCYEDNRPLYRYLLPHINEILETRKISNLHVNDKMAFGEVLDSGGRYRDAEELFEEALESLQQVSEEETADMVTVKSWLAISYSSQGRWDEAEALQVDVLEQRQKILGVDHPDSISAANNLALTYSNQGHWDEAERLGVDVLEKRQRIMGADHPHTLTTANNLAGTYLSQGRWDEAEKLQVDVLEKWQKIQGVDHPASLKAANNLALNYWNQGRWDEAEKLGVDVLKRQERIQGADHPNSLLAANNLAMTYSSQGRWGEAEKLQLEVLEKCQRIQGVDHPDTLMSANNLAMTYCNQGRLDEAEKLQLDVLERWQKLQGTDHPSSLMAASNLVFTYSNQGRWDEAEKLGVDVLERRQRVLGVDHPDSLTAANNLAMNHSYQGRWDEAETLQLEVLEKRRRIQGADHPESLVAASNLAATYSYQGRWAEAEKLEMNILERRQRILGADHPDSIAAASNLAATYCSPARWLDAEPIMERVVEQSIRVMGKRHPATQSYLEQLIDVYTELGKSDKVLEMKKLLIGQADTD